MEHLGERAGAENDYHYLLNVWVPTTRKKRVKRRTIKGDKGFLGQIEEK